ncbi:hypothetical protein BDF14DRAFT_1816119 [Spinellus fusiger]|nr:hypothetical protein BDF14DRAFT_1816119 [Spinellus fusiger]
MSHTTEPISILKSSPQTGPTPSEYPRTARIVMSDDDDEDYHHDPLHRYLSDGEEDDPSAVPLSEQAVELLKTEKVVNSGYLLKKGEKRRTWKKRWFVLRTTKMAMYKDDKEYKLLRIIDLHEIHSVVQVTSKNKYKHVFAIITPKRMYYVQAKDQQEMNTWFEHIEHTKRELKLYDTEEDASLMDRDQDYAKDVISSYQSKHAATTGNQHRSSTHMMALQEGPSGSVSPIEHSTAQVPPLDIPSAQRLFSSSQAYTYSTLQGTSLQGTSHYEPGSYSTSNTYPLSPASDRQAQLHITEGLASSEDDEDYFCDNDRRNIQMEETRNKVLIEGYLLKLGRNKGWRKRWFVLRTDTLAYYEDDKEYSPRRIIPLTHILDSLEIEPMSKSKRFCFKIIIPKRSYVLCVGTEVELESWLDALSVAVRRVKKDGEGRVGTAATPRPLSQIPENDALRCTTVSSNESFDNSSYISGAGGVGGAGGALGGHPSIGMGRVHSRHSERLGKAK